MPSAPSERMVGTVVACALVAIAASMALFAIGNTDLWWVLSVGRKIVDAGTFIYSDPFMFTRAGVPWSPQSWLACVILFAFYAKGGVIALVVLRALLVAAAVALTLRTLWRVGVSATLSAPLIVLFLFTSRDRFDVGTDLFGYVFLAAMLLFLAGAHRARNWSFYAVPAVLQIAWVNTQSDFLLGPLVVALYFLGEYVSTRVSANSPAIVPMHEWDFRRAGILVVVLLAACFVSPNPASIALYPFDPSHRELLSQVSVGWRSAFDPSLSDAPFHPWFEISLAVAALATLVSLRQLTLAPLFLLVATALLSIQSNRFRVEFAMIVAIFVPVLLARSPLVDRIRASFATRTAAVVVTLVLASAMILTHLDRLHADIRISEAHLDSTFAFVRDNDIAHRPFTTVEFGSFMTWDLGGARSVFIDGHNPSLSVYRDFVLAQNTTAGLQQIVDKYDLDSFVIPPPEDDDSGWTRMHRALTEQSRWCLVRVDRSAYVYVDSASVPAAWLSEHAYREYQPITFGNRPMNEASMDRAIAELKRATRLSPEYGRPWVDLSLLQMTRGQREEALSSLRSASAVSSQDPALWNRVGKMAQEAGENDIAVAAFAGLTRLTPKDPLAHVSLGRALEAAERPLEAAAAYDAAIRVAPEYVDAYASLLRVQLVQKNYDDAIKLAERAEAALPGRYEGPYYRAEVALRLGRNAEAIAQGEEAIRRNPRAAAVRMLLAKAYIDTRNYSKALYHVEGMLEFDPENPSGLDLRQQLRDALR